MAGSLIGRRVGPYDVTALLGAGGMGEVYRAADARLGRDVAIKVIPPSLVGDRDRLSRFEREARLLASLHHPNIAAVYGLEESGDVRAKRVVNREDHRMRMCGEKMGSGVVSRGHPRSRDCTAAPVL